MSSSMLSQAKSYWRWMTGSWRPEDLPTTGKETSLDQSDCRFPLGVGSSATFTLPDQRKLGYAEYGSPTGRPIFHVHGWPGSRIEGAFFHNYARNQNARIISVDRPGYGWSSPHPDRTILDHAKDITQLAKHLKLKEYAVLGVSGGGPYAMACAAVMPSDELKGVASVIGLGPPDIGHKGMATPNYIGWTYGFRYLPGLCRWYFSRTPGARLDLDQDKRFEMMFEENSKAQLHPKEVEMFKDKELKRDIFRLTVQVNQQSYNQGMIGPSLDAKLMASPWGFRVEDIRPDLPIFLWYGKYDLNVPANAGIQLAARLGSRAQLHVQDETHWTMVKHVEDAIADLVGCF